MYIALVVDDEEIIRNGICKKLSRFFDNLEIAPAQENAIEALHYIQNHHVDIVLVDIKMPMVDGLEFIKRARQHNSQLKFIVISGFKNFEYAKSAITLGVKDYLLKPIDNGEFKKVIGELIIELDKKKENQKKENAIKTKAYEGSALKRSRYLTELVSADASIDTTELIADLKELEISFQDTNYVVLSVMASNIKKIPEFKNVSGLSILQYAVCNVMDEVFCNFGSNSFSHQKEDFQFVIILNTESTISSYFILQKTNKLIDLLKNIYGLELKIGIGQEVHHITDVCKSYQQAYQSMLQCTMPESKDVCFFDDINDSKNSIQLISGFQKDLLESYIKNQNEKEIKNSMKEIFQDLISNNYENLKIIGYDIYFIVVKLLKENDKDMEIAYTMFTELEKMVSSGTNTEPVKQWLGDKLTEVSKMFISGKKSYGKSLIEEINKYVENNYSKDISLGTIANKFFINQSYLSQMFKKEMNIKFIDYITSIRLGKAKELLKTTSLSVNEIAETIGYSDTRYFREVFLKHTKETPSQYRKKYLSRIMNI